MSKVGVIYEFDSGTHLEEIGDGLYSASISPIVKTSLVKAGRQLTTMTGSLRRAWVRCGAGSRHR